MITLLKYICIILFCNFSLQAEWEILNNDFHDIHWQDIYANGDDIYGVGYSLSSSSQGTFSRGFLLYSQDNGLTFDTLGVSDYIFLKSIAFPTENHGVIGGFGMGDYSVVLNTSDRGQNWVWKMDQTTGGIADIMFLDENTGFAAGYGDKQLTDGLLQKTTDGGLTWQPTCTSVAEKTIDVVHFADENVGYTLSRFMPPGMLHKTTDGGVSWETMLTAEGYLKDMHFFDENNGILLSSTVIYRTEDAGQTWQEQEIGNSSGHMQSFDFYNEKFGYMVGSTNNYKGIIYKTTDGGTSWNRENFGDHPLLYNVEFHGKNAWAVGEGILIKSDEILSAKENSKQTKEFRFYPNPVVNNAYLEMPDMSYQELSIEFYNVIGNKVKEIHTGNATKVLLTRDELMSGYYFYSVYLDGSFYGSGSVIIE